MCRTEFKARSRHWMTEGRVNWDRDALRLTVGANYLRCATPSGQLYTLGRNPKGTGAGKGVNTELAGCCFSPDGSVLFVNLYNPGTTLAITGPWRSSRT